jgi:hypothetical protein
MERRVSRRGVGDRVGVTHVLHPRAFADEAGEAAVLRQRGPARGRDPCGELIDDDRHGERGMRPRRRRGGLHDLGRPRRSRRRRVARDDRCRTGEHERDRRRLA